MIRVRSSDALMQRPGEGDAYIFKDQNWAPLRAAFAQQEENNLKRAKLQADHDKELRDKLDYNPKGIWSPVDKRHQEKVLDIIKHNARLKSKPVEFDDPDRIDYEVKKAKIEQDINKSAELEKAHLEALKRAKADPYYHTDKAQNELNNITFGEDRKGLKSVDDLNIDDYEKPFNNPDNFNMTHAAQTFSKNLPEQVKSYISQQKNDQGERFNENLVKSKFYKYDGNGNQILDDNGKPVINITPETKHAFYNSHPLIQPYIAKEMEKPENKGKSEDQIVQSIISPYAVHESNKSIGALSKNDNGDDSVKATTFTDQTRNTVAKQANGDNKVTPGWVPEEIRLEGKKMDKPLVVNAKTFYDQNTNSPIKDIVGDKDVRITRMVKLPVDPKTGQIIHGDKTKVLNHKNGTVYEWYAAGRFNAGDKDVPDEKDILIKYEDIAPDLKSAYGIDLNGKDDPYGVKQKSSSPLSKIK